MKRPHSATDLAKLTAEPPGAGIASNLVARQARQVPVFQISCFQRKLTTKFSRKLQIFFQRQVIKSESLH
jgi:hypothetical protein